MAFRFVHALRRWSFTLCTSRATSITGYLDILNAIFLLDFTSRRHSAPMADLCPVDLFGPQLQPRWTAVVGGHSGH
jgi:hypothetical protein